MLVLDTHAWVWFVTASPRLRATAVEAMEATVAGGRFLIPAIAVWEVALLVARGRLALRAPLRDWIDAALDDDYFELAALTPDIAIRGAGLPARALSDPADRMIVATAMEAQVPVATRDSRIVSFCEAQGLDVLPI
jgi:PIN domain nuclease of toxin-antitoxin system